MHVFVQMWTQSPENTLIFLDPSCWISNFPNFCKSFYSPTNLKFMFWIPSILTISFFWLLNIFCWLIYWHIKYWIREVDPKSILSKILYKSGFCLNWLYTLIISDSINTNLLTFVTDIMIWSFDLQVLQSYFLLSRHSLILL